MSQIAIAGNQVVITSSVTLENLRLAEKLRPDALVLKDEDGNETFRVSVGSNSIGPKGISYSSTTRDERGLATVSAVIPEDVENAKDYIVDTYGLAIERLGKVEAALPDVINEIVNARNNLRSKIITMGAPSTPQY